jgi:CitMHS family citrate-Mg2+:H+ or citrate-Ca2+:H+ symporter
MLTLLGFLAIAVLLGLMLFRVTSVLVALTLVPLVVGLLGGFGSQMGGFALDGMRDVAPTAALLAFAVVYFGVMRDAGLFTPLIRVVVRAVGRDPLKVIVGTAVIATVSHLDGAGASTFMVTIPAMLPLYQRLRLDPLAWPAPALAAGTANLLPWAGPATRAATALGVSPTELYLPLLPANLAGVLGVAAWRGVRATSPRVAALGVEGAGAEALQVPDAAASPERPRLWWFNAALTLVTLAALVAQTQPLPVVFLVASAVALVVNHPDLREQRERLAAHGNAAMLMLTTIMAAGVFTGILEESGMLAAMAQSTTAPAGDGRTHPRPAPGRAPPRGRGRG